MRDNVSKLGRVLSALALPAANIGAINGPDNQLSAHNAATLYILAGTWTDGIHTIVIQEAPDVSGAPGAYTPVAATDLVAFTATSATDHTPVKIGSSQPAVISSAATALNQRIGYIGGQPWIRAVVTASGTTTGAVYDAVWVNGEPRMMPDYV